MNLLGHKSNVWIGLQSDSYEKWLNGQEVEYANWSPAQVRQCSLTFLYLFCTLYCICNGCISYIDRKRRGKAGENMKKENSFLKKILIRNNQESIKMVKIKMLLNQAHLL